MLVALPKTAAIAFADHDRAQVLSVRELATSYFPIMTCSPVKVARQRSPRHQRMHSCRRTLPFPRVSLGAIQRPKADGDARDLDRVTIAHMRDVVEDLRGACGRDQPPKVLWEALNRFVSDEG